MRGSTPLERQHLVADGTAVMGTVADLQVEVHNGLVNCVRVGEPKEVCSLKNPGKEASCACADGQLELSTERENGLIGESESRKPWVHCSCISSIIL